MFCVLIVIDLITVNKQKGEEIALIQSILDKCLGNPSRDPPMKLKK